MYIIRKQHLRNVKLRRTLQERDLCHSLFNDALVEKTVLDRVHHHSNNKQNHHCIKVAGEALLTNTPGNNTNNSTIILIVQWTSRISLATILAGVCSAEHAVSDIIADYCIQLFKK
jgi:hypothetical protein